MRFTAYAETDTGAAGIVLKSCGHIFAQPGRTIDRPQGRDDWLIFYVAKGQEKFTFTSAATACEGGFVLYRPGEPQKHICIGERPAEFYYIHFTAPADFDAFGLKSSAVHAAEPSSAIVDLFETIIREVQMKQACFGEICAARLIELLAQLKRRISGGTAQSREHMDKIAFIAELIHREYARPRTLEEYARLCGMSKYHSLRVFKSITGISPMEYRSNLRIEHAREMLEDSRLSVGEIGEALGYASASYFCDAFKRRVGISPAQYRASRQRM